MPAISSNRYTVQPRDTLGAIAIANGTTAAELARLNNISDANSIAVGQVIKLFPDSFERTERNGVMGTAGYPPEVVGRRDILAAAEALARDKGLTYATDAHAHSPNPAFPSSGTPGGYWKCNMFAGDVLYMAGFEAPRYESGWYALSQSWHKYDHLFEKVPLHQAQAGDVLILDRGRTNDAEGGGHALILTSTIASDGSYGCIAVKAEGAKAHQRNVKSDTSGRDADGNQWQAFALRPIKRRFSGQVPDAPVVDPSSVRAPTGTLQKGASGDDVKMLQQCLVKLGHMKDAEMQTGPGIFGDKTKNAVIRLQQAEGVAVEPGAEGIYGPKTRAALEAALARA